MPRSRSRHYALWKLRVEDVLEAIDSIRQHTAGLSPESFAVDPRSVHAVSYNFAIIGEAAQHVPNTVQTRYPEIPWAKMRAMRNVLVHEYATVDPVILWDTSQHDLPPFVPRLRAILEQEA